MKKTITLLALFTFGVCKSQTVADFESFSLPVDSFYYNAGGADWQTTNASFQYEWNTSFGGYWSGGFAYTNKNNVDSGNYRHQYNCIAGKGYNLSNYYTTGQPGSFIRVKAPSTGVVGFYLTNSTYAYKSMKNGDSFAKKFGGTTGNDPDWFKLTVKGYSGGTIKPDSVEFYLADFRFSNNLLDYIVNSWQWVDCNKLGATDSITFFMYSSDNSFGFMNTPAFFSIDNFTTGQGVGIAEASLIENITIFPNPANDVLNIKFNSQNASNTNIKVYTSTGILAIEVSDSFHSVNKDFKLNISGLSTGLYLMEIISDGKKQNVKFIKE